MLLLLVLTTAAIFYPALSQPARSQIFDESDYPVPIYHSRSPWGMPVGRPHKTIDFAQVIKELEAMKLSDLFPQQERSGKPVDSSGVPFKASKRMIGAGKRNFDEIDRSGFNGFVKKNFDEIDRSGFNSLVKKNFDEIDRNGFNGFIKKNMNRFENNYR